MFYIRIYSEIKEGSEEMPLVSILEELKRARDGHYALPLYDTADARSTEGMLDAFESCRAAGMIALYQGVFDRPNGEALAAYIRVRAEEASVPISLMLDHGQSFEQCVRALVCGFTDVMYDGSQLPLEENIATTRAVVRAAHAVGAGVEAELGHVGRASEYAEVAGQRKGFTDPDTVEMFIQETGVDILAIAIGTAHGVYDGEPQIDVELLKEIRRRVDIPLALHGGSGCTDAQFRAVVAEGISKVNVATDLFLTAGSRIHDSAVAGESSYHAFGQVATEAFEDRCGYYLDLFSAIGSADRNGS
jgi:fructose-bisphosphate aldolase, class II